MQKPYSISMSMRYEDGNAAQYESSSSLAIPVKQSARFEFSDLEIAPEAVAVGEEANITCSLYNTGRIKLYNVKATFQGEGIDAKEVFIGNVDSGATGSIDGIVTATQETQGDQKYKMVVTYEDESGKVSTTEKEFTMQIMPAQAPVDMSQMTDVPAQKGLPIVPIIVGVVIIAGIVIAVIVIRRKKKKIESVEEEDLLDEVDRFTEDE
ncbi:MAG: CARDB domain-containing protein [Muricomes sp.]